jgi:hypothetical protein
MKRKLQRLMFLKEREVAGSDDTAITMTMLQDKTEE